jgi:hypothetical protein
MWRSDPHPTLDERQTAVSKRLMEGMYLTLPFF